MSTAIDLKTIEHDGEWTRRRKITEALLDFSLGKSFEFEERDITRPCVGTVHNGQRTEEPTGDKEFIIRMRIKPTG